MRKIQLLGRVAIGVLASGPLFADTTSFTTPAYRGQAGTTFTGWETFRVGIGEPGNAGDLAGSYNGARLYQTAPGAMVLGSGNIYNGSDKSSFDIRYTGSDSIGLVTLQVRTLGTELAYDSVELLAAADAGPQTLTTPRTELERLTFGPPPPAPGGGVAVSSLWQWDLTGLGADYVVISLDAAELNLSFDAATLDVQIVPEPGTATLLMAGLAAIGLGTRRLRG